MNDTPHARGVFLAAMAVVVLGAAVGGGSSGGSVLGPFAIGAPAALTIGMVLALLGLSAFEKLSKQAAKLLIQVSIVLLGFSIPLGEVARAGLAGLGLAAGTIALALAAGLLLGRLLKTDRELTTLLTSGTAICGGSAIAATGAAIRASAASISLATAIVFLLNAGGVYAYPPLGRWMGLSQAQFGAWSAIGIHDTAGVVAAAKTYGSEALAQATIIKLTRVLWIVPVSLVLAARHRVSGGAVPSVTTGTFATAATSAAPRLAWASIVPWFITGFLLACLLRTMVPALADPRDWLPGGVSVAEALRWLGKFLLTVALFLIGTGLSRKALAAAGWRPLALGIALWLIVSIASLVAVRAFVG